MSTGKAILASIRQQLNLTDYRKIHWEGTFDEYLDIVREHSDVTRTAYQRLYDMILSHGTEEVFENKEKIIRYRFFTDYAAKHGDAIYGLDRPLMQLVNAFKSAAKGYGTERRVLLLHGPVGSSKSTIARLLKRGIEDYARSDNGMLFSYSWRGADSTWQKCPMHEDPLHLAPKDLRAALLSKLNENLKPGDPEVTIRGDMCPFCRQMFNERLARYDGDWHKMLEDIKVYRLLLSEQDRIGIGTFQPKDEKNQDSTELTGDINYRKIAEYGTDSDPRCVHVGTHVASNEGIRAIESLLPFAPKADTFTQRPLVVSSINEAPVAHSSSVYSAGEQPLRTIQTRLGYRLTATNNHMVLSLTPEGEPVWKEMRLIQEGDFVAMGRGIHTWATEDQPLPEWQHKYYGNERHQPTFPQRVTPELGRLLGLWIGDGHFFIRKEEHIHEFGWTQKAPEGRDEFCSLLRNLFGVEARNIVRENHAGQVLIGSRALVSWLQEVVGLKAGARSKAIPDVILRSSRETLLACLRGLWETDGTIRCREDGSNWAMFATCSDTLARQVHLVLLALGVVASLVKAPSDWEVRVYGQNVNKLVELIPSLGSRFTVGQENHARPAPNVDVIPHIKPKLKGVYQRAQNRDDLKTRFSGNLHDSAKPNVSYGLLEDFLAVVQPAEEDATTVRLLRHLLQQRHVWLPVTHVVDAGRGQAYDLSVAQTHAYWADGFISHNCFNFDGELNIANRGIVEFIEVLKLDVAFLYDLLGASQEHKIKPKKFAQTDIDEVILGHSVAGNTPIPYRHDGQPGWATLEKLHDRFAGDASGLEVLAHDFATGKTTWTPVRQVFRHRFTGRMLTTSQKWGAVETTPNHSIYDRSGQAFYPDDRHEIMAVRGLPELFAPIDGVEVIDVLEGVAGFVRDKVAVTSRGGRMTRPCPEGWARLDLPRHATAVRAVYDPIVDVEPLKDLITVLVWYATEGHINARNGGLVISQADPAELERVRAAYARITTGKGSIDQGAKTDSAWRLYLGSQAVAKLCQHHCGELSVNKRLPDFLFRLPTAYVEHAFDEMMRTDGSRRLSKLLEESASDAYREKFFEYKTISPLLAAQVGTLASLLGLDYSIYQGEREGRSPAYRVRFVSGTGKRGGRHDSFEARLHERQVVDEWVYDIECAGLHNFVCGVGNVVASNTNEPEYRRLQNNEFMEALRDRTVKIDVPYVTRLKDEIKIYEKDFNVDRVKGKHIAPHTIEIAAMWAVLTRLVQPKHANLTLLQKLKLYNGKTLPGFTEDNVIELKREAVAEGMHGISPRYIQDKISNAIVAHPDEDCVNPFMVLHELEAGLRHHSLITSQEQLQHYRELLAVVKEEYEDIVKNEVQRAIAADEDALARLCSNYIDNVKAYTQREKVRNRYTGNYEDPDERLMRSVEEKIDIPEGRKDDFRREIMNYIGALAVDGKRFDYKTNERLQKALELKLFEDQKDTIKLTSLVSNVVDKATQEKIDVVKSRLIRNYGYNESSATDVLTFVASIFARGHTKK
jgi:serine protein kinase